MKLAQDIPGLRSWRQGISTNQSVGFVPTMGALHEGHISLVRRSVADNDHTVVSIFVNPTQFGPNEDFDRYPRNLEADMELLEDLGVSLVFAPNREAIYPGRDFSITYQIHHLDTVLCGASRPGHMNGVCQVVTILFHLVQPDRAYFGEKDYQQYLILATMARELHFPTEVIPCPIVREDDGLAMSSRNRYLDPKSRPQALFLHDTLQAIRVKAGDWQNVQEIKELVQERLADYPLVKLDYFEVLRSGDLLPPAELSPAEAPRLFVAAWLGKTRLIDNMPLYEV